MEQKLEDYEKQANKAEYQTKHIALDNGVVGGGTNIKIFGGEGCCDYLNFIWGTSYFSTKNH